MQVDFICVAAKSIRPIVLPIVVDLAIAEFMLSQRFNTRWSMERVFYFEAHETKKSPIKGNYNLTRVFSLVTVFSLEPF